MKKLLLLELVFIFTAIALVPLSTSASSLNIFFTLTIVFAAVFTWFENKQLSLFKGAQYGAVIGLVWGLIYLAVGAFTTVLQFVDLLSSENKLLTELNGLRLNGDMYLAALGTKTSTYLIYALLVMIALSVILGGASGFISAYIMRKNKKSRKK
jgi:hypothetical protein